MALACSASPDVSTPGAGILRHIFVLLFLAFCFFVVWNYGWLVFILGGGCIAGLISLPVAFWKGVVIPLVCGVECPTCREWGLMQVACLSFGDRFYRCDHCGQRCKRKGRDFAWLDASGKEDDEMYKPVPGPARRHEVRKNAVRELAALVAFVACILVASIFPPWDRFIPAIFLIYAFHTRVQSSQKVGIPIRPILWDREIDA